jgi:hypothetical protein
MSGLDRRMRNVIALLALPVFLAACVSIPKNAFKLSQSSLEIRKMQTRKFDTKDEVALLSAGAAQLQDMGYIIDETEKDVGLIAASKDADATDGKQVAQMVAFVLFTGAAPPIDRDQKIRVSFVTIPSGTNSGSYLARITFQRIVWNDRGHISRVETISDPKIYQDFFSGLSKSVFLEANQI